MMRNQGSGSRYEGKVGLGRRILVVDDDATVRLTLARSLQRDGYQVSLAKRGHEALGIIESQGEHDLVVLDVMMPGMDGFALAYEICKGSDAPIVVLSSITDPDTKVEALIEFAEAYVTKPFHVDELMARIWRILTRRPVDSPQISGVGSRIENGRRLRTPVLATNDVIGSNAHRSYVAAFPCLSR